MAPTVTMSRAVTLQGVMTWEEPVRPGPPGGGGGEQPGQPPGIWGPNDPRPTPPIHLPPWYPGQPPGIWGGAPLPWPTPPIYYPPGIWGPTDPRPSNPIANVPGISNPNPPGWGARPEHPIYYPPGIWGPTDPRPGWGLPGQPPGIWGGGNQPFPTPPIHLPPGVGSGNPPIIWGGGNVPMPTPPIHLGPGGEVGGPPGIWGPNDPRPGWGLPDTPDKPNLPPGGTPIPPSVGVPIEGYVVFVPGQGWVFVPKPGGGGVIGAPKPPDEGGEEPQPEPK